MDINDVLRIIQDRRKELHGEFRSKYYAENKYRLNELTTIKKRITNYQKASQSNIGQGSGRSNISSTEVIVVPDEIRGTLLDLAEILDGRNI